MKRTAMQHTKLKRLVRGLKVPQYAAVGILESLWHLTAREALMGNIGKLSNEDIAAWIDWEGDADLLVSALVSAGWVDEDPTHRLVIHDWLEHADDTTKKAISRHSQPSAENGGNVQTKPDKTPLPEPLPLPEPKPVQKQKPSRAKRESVPDPRHDEFKQVFTAYFAHANNGLEAPWDGQEGSHLKRFLDKNPNFTTEQWRTLLWNRARSDVVHGENLSTWISRALTWAFTPTGKSGGPNGFKGKTESSVDAAKSAISTILRGDEENRHRGAVDETRSQAAGEVIPPGLPGASGGLTAIRSLGH